MTDTGLTTIGPLQQALALASEAGDLDSLRDIASMATALQHGARTRGLGVDAENQAAEVILRAERTMGSVLDRMTEEGTRRTRGSNRAEGDDLPGLAELGISMKEAHLWRTLAAIPDADFERRFATIRATGTRIAKVDFYRLVKGGEKVRKEAVRDIVDAMTADDDTPAFAAFDKAADDLIAAMPTLPTDELAQVALIIRELVDTYQSARAARG